MNATYATIRAKPMEWSTMFQVEVIVKSFSDKQTERQIILVIQIVTLLKKIFGEFCDFGNIGTKIDLFLQQNVQL